MRLLPDTSLDQVMNDPFDMIVLPGGLPGADHLNQDPRIHQLLKRLSDEGGYTAAICAAPKVLLNAGLLNGKKATSYPGALDGLDLKQMDLQLERVVTDGKVVTSRGPGTAMDFALQLIEQLVGVEVRDKVEQGLVR
jgi:4-methyl-5(b-hydroxyethyl)-thiazole monophosphate biosynthesis